MTPFFNSPPTAWTLNSSVVPVLPQSTAVPVLPQSIVLPEAQSVSNIFWYFGAVDSIKNETSYLFFQKLSKGAIGNFFKECIHFLFLFLFCMCQHRTNQNHFNTRKLWRGRHCCPFWVRFSVESVISDKLKYFRNLNESNVKVPPNGKDRSWTFKSLIHFIDSNFCAVIIRGRPRFLFR